MKINDTNVRGIWSYSDSLVFEKGDFVVKGDQIYICKESGVQGIDPGNRDYFTEYPGNMVRSLEEYYRIVNDPEASDDLYISSRVLNEILQDSYFGLGDNGIIESVIESDGTLSGQIRKLVNSEHILDSLLLSPDFNNGIVLVSREFKDIKGLVGALSFVLEDDVPAKIYKIDPTKCIGCGSCFDVCPQAAISLTGSEEIVTCTLCGHIYTYEELHADDGIDYYHGHPTCPSCHAPVGRDTKIVNNYKINTTKCNNCGLCYNNCPEGAISLVDNTTTINTSVNTPESTANQSFSNMISKYQVSDLGYVFVRQYSYKSGATGMLHRIQELVDPDQGLIYFRHAAQKDGALTMDSTSWKECLSRDAIVMGRELSKIREKLAKEETAATTSGFRYVSVPVNDRNNNAYYISNNDLPVVSGDVKRIVTLVMELQGKTISSYSASIDLSNPDDYKDPGKAFYLDDNVSFVVISAVGGFDLRFDVDPDQTLLLKDVYCREAC